MFKINFTLNRILIFLVLAGYTNSCKKSISKERLEAEAIYRNEVIQAIKSQSRRNILVCAHRGFHREAPENSIKSIQDAIEANIDIVEVDVRTTKDSVLILMHDDKIDRTTTGEGYVKDYTYAQLLEFNLRLGDSLTHLKIPNLEDVLSVSKDRVILNLDLKDVEPIRLFRLLKKKNMEHQVFSFVWNKSLIKEIIEIDSLYAVLPLSSNMEDMEMNLKRYHSTLQHFDDSSFTSEGMDWAKKQDVQVFVNSLWVQDESFSKGETTQIDSLISLKPNIIQTDYPDKLIAYLKSKGLHE